MPQSTHVVESLFDALASGASGAELERFFHPDAEQIEHPNRFRPAGHRRGLRDMLDASTVGAGMLREQRYDVHELLESGDRVAVQLTWTATTAIDLGDLPSGSRLVARVAMFFEFRDGRILRQNSYDCYEPVGASTAA